MKSRPLVVGNSLEDIFGSSAVVVKGGGDGGMRRRRRATALMNACQHELPLDVALIIRRKVGQAAPVLTVLTALHFEIVRISNKFTEMEMGTGTVAACRLPSRQDARSRSPRSFCVCD